MWGHKFGFAVGSALSFLFEQFSKVKGLFLMTFLVVGGIALVITILVGEKIRQALVMVPIQDGSGFQVEFTHLDISSIMIVLMVVGIIIALLSFLPYLVGIQRAVVLDETANSSVLTAIFQGRQMRYLWANIKIYFMIFVLFLPFIALVAVAMGSAAMVTQGGTLSLSSGAMGAFGLLLFATLFATFIAVIVLVPRWLLAPVLAAIDKGTSLKDSRHLTKGSWWLIVLSYVVTAIMVFLGSFVLGFVLGLVGVFILGPLALLFNPIVGIALSVLLYILVNMIVMMPAAALFGYLYLIMTDQVKLGEIKRKKA